MFGRELEDVSSAVAVPHARPYVNILIICGQYYKNTLDMCLFVSCLWTSRIFRHARPRPASQFRESFPGRWCGVAAVISLLKLRVRRNQNKQRKCDFEETSTNVCCVYLPKSQRLVWKMCITVFLLLSPRCYV